MPAPPFGTASAYTDSFPSPPPRQVTISSETCFNLGVFKGELRIFSEAGLRAMNVILALIYGRLGDLDAIETILFQWRPPA